MMSRSRITFGLALLAVVGTTALLTGCGVSRVVDPVAQAANQSERSGGADITVTMSVATGSSAPVTITGSGVIANDAADLTMDFGGLGSSVGLSKVEELIVSEDGRPVMYMAMGALMQNLGTNKKWLRIDFAKAGSLGSAFSKLLGSGQQNPADVLQTLKQAGDFQEIGKATIDGDVTTHYEGSVDVAKAAKDEGVDLKALAGADAAAIPGAVPYEVYVGSDGKVRRVSFSYDVPAASGASGHVEMTMDYTHWGIDPLIGPPPADEVFDATSLLSKSLSGG
jgi:hypothetical protein